MTIYAGRLNERVTVQRPTEARNMLGEATLGWEDVAVVWASVEGMSSRDVLQAMQANVVATHRIRIRALAGVNHECRIIWRGRTMEVASVVDRDHRTVLEMLAREVT